jgi:hypothetical protein
MIKLLFSLLLVMTISAAQAQDNPEAMIENFFSMYEKDGAIKALDSLYSSNPWIARNQDAVENLKSSLSAINTLVGDYYGYEYINHRSVGDSFILYSYMVRYDRQPIRFQFQFYKPHNEWRIFSFSYDEELDDEIEEAAKLYFNH